jgi:hypothetical protein
MDTLKIQDVFEPYYDGRKKGLARVDPRAVERAKEARDRIEQDRRAAQAHPKDDDREHAA